MTSQPCPFPSDAAATGESHDAAPSPTAGLPGNASAPGVSPPLVGNLPDLGTLREWQCYEASLAPLWLGSPAHAQFLGWLEQQLAGIGLSVSRQAFEVPYWNAQRGGIAIGEEMLPVAGYLPSSRPTPAEGITAELFDGGVKTSIVKGLGPIPSEAFPPAPGKIVLTEFTKAEFHLEELVKSTRTYPVSEPYPLVQRGTSNTLPGPNLEAMAEAGALGAINVWRDVTPEAAQDHMIPMRLGGPMRPIPGLWVARDVGARLRLALDRREQVTMHLEATYTPRVETATLWAVLPGQTDEIVIVTTHTDGVSAYQENGAINLLALATAAARLPLEQRRRTIVFVMSTGHFGHRYIHCVQEWQKAHPEIMDKAVAALAIEHVGGQEWTDVDGVYRATGRPNWAQAFVTNGGMEDIYMSAVERAGLDRSAALRARGTMMGEGSKFASIVPTIGYIEFAEWMFTAPRNGAIDKIDPARQHHCLRALADVLAQLDAAPLAELQR